MTTKKEEVAVEEDSEVEEAAEAATGPQLKVEEEVEIEREKRMKKMDMTVKNTTINLSQKQEDRTRKRIWRWTMITTPLFENLEIPRVILSESQRVSHMDCFAKIFIIYIHLLLYLIFANN